MSARDLFGGIARHHGCKCGACKATAKYADQGFSSWPKGERATPSEARKIYTAHVSFNWKDARKRADLGPAGVGFYGLASVSKAEAERVLQESFRESAP